MAWIRAMKISMTGSQKTYVRMVRRALGTFAHVSGNQRM